MLRGTGFVFTKLWQCNCKKALGMAKTKTGEFMGLKFLVLVLDEDKFA